MIDLLLHPQTRKAIEQVTTSQTHALLITGEPGAGKRTAALSIAKELLKTKSLDSAPYFTHIQDESKALGIEQIRELQKRIELPLFKVE